MTSAKFNSIPQLSRRQLIGSMALLGPAALISGTAIPNLAMAANNSTPDDIGPYPASWLPEGIRSRFVDDINGLRVHVLEAGYETSNRPDVQLAGMVNTMPTFMNFDDSILFATLWV